MKVHGLVVSVDYAAELDKSLPRWMSGLDSLTIVTAPRDVDSQKLGQDKVQVFCTDAFYRNGAHFNKGLSQQLAWRFVPKEDWILLFDADITPPANWKQQLETSNLQPGYLYGAWRYDESGERLKDDCHGYGYLQLFHSSDPIAQREPFFDIDWTHAGCGDSFILLRWRDAGRLAPVLPLKLTHTGIGPSENWYGRGKRAEFEAMQVERRRRGGGWASIEGERLKI